MATSKDYSRSVIGASDELQDIFCEPCEHEGRRVEAEGYCVDCSEYLCGQCYKNHTRYKAFRQHVLQDKDTMPLNASEANVKDLCVQNCPKHPLEIVKYFCGKCDSLGCTACITLDHKQCRDVAYIPKIVEAKRNHDEFRNFNEKLNKMCKQVAESKNRVGFMSNMSDELKRVAKTALKKQRSEINTFFDELEVNMEKKIDEIDNSNRTVITTASRNYDSVSKDLMRLKSDVDTKQNTGQNCEVFIAIKSADPNLENLERELQNMETENKIQKYKLHPLTQIQDMIKNMTGLCRMDIEKMPLIMDVGRGSNTQPAVAQKSEYQVKPKATAAVGKAETKKDESLKKESKSTASQLSCESTSSSQSRYTTENMANKSSTAALKTLSFQTEIDTSTSNVSTYPYIRGIAVVQEHFAVFADSNQSVKVIDTRTKKVTSEMTMGEDVNNVTHVNDDKVAVALDTTIQFLSVSRSGSLSKDYAIDVSMICWDLVYYDRRLIVAQGSQVAILDMQGKVLRTFKTDSNGKSLFTRCFGLAISSDNDTIYVSDRDQHTVTSLTLDGKVKQIYTDTELKYPWGITVDNEGYVYVCSTMTRMIHQLSADCTKLQVFPDTPGTSITFSNRNKLYQGWSKDMKIYEIK